MKQIPHDILYHDFLSSLVCGQNLTSEPLKTLLINSSLIHLVVVSGSHFLVLFFILNLLTKKSWIHGLVMASYWLMTGAQAPGLLALLLWILRKHAYQISLKAHQQIFLAGLGCFLISPQMMTKSASLYLSWLCCLALCFANFGQSEEKWFKTPILIYLLINILGGWASWSHPLSILFNLTLGLFLSGVLFPLGIFVTTTHLGKTFFDYVITDLIWILKNLGPNPSPRTWIWTPSWWILVAIFHLSLSLYDLISARNQLTKKFNLK